MLGKLDAKITIPELYVVCRCQLLRKATQGIDVVGLHPQRHVVVWDGFVQLPSPGKNVGETCMNHGVV